MTVRAARADFAALLGPLAARRNSLRARRPLRSDSRRESVHVRAKARSASGPSITAATEIAPAGHRLPRGDTELPLLQRRVWVGCVAQSGKAPALFRLVPVARLRRAPSHACRKLFERSGLRREVSFCDHGHKTEQRRFSRRCKRRPPCRATQPTHARLCRLTYRRTHSASASCPQWPTHLACDICFP